MADNAEVKDEGENWREVDACVKEAESKVWRVKVAAVAARLTMLRSGYPMMKHAPFITNFTILDEVSLLSRGRLALKWR